MQTRNNRRALEEGILRLMRKSDFRLLTILYALWRYIMGEDD